ncbi:hypothetical protein J6590_032579 [Homalodisca vitripennis]|nr:hypothetical protein J6590_032579 [Homalodisca vitripennis]
MSKCWSYTLREYDEVMGTYGAQHWVVSKALSSHESGAKFENSVWVRQLRLEFSLLAPQSFVYGTLTAHHLTISVLELSRPGSPSLVVGTTEVSRHSQWEENAKQFSRPGLPLGRLARTLSLQDCNIITRNINCILTGNIIIS